jgi:hypothetical protein
MVPPKEYVCLLRLTPLAALACPTKCKDTTVTSRKEQVHAKQLHVSAALSVLVRVVHSACTRARAHVSRRECVHF